MEDGVKYKHFNTAQTVLTGRITKIVHFTSFMFYGCVTIFFIAT